MVFSQLVARLILILCGLAQSLMNLVKPLAYLEIREKIVSQKAPNSFSVRATFLAQVSALLSRPLLVTHKTLDSADISCC